MINVDIRALLLKMNPFCTAALQNAAGLCVSRTNYEVMIEHFLLKCIENDKSDLTLLLKRFEIDPARFAMAVNRTLEEAKTGNAGKPLFSPLLVELTEDAWLVSSIDMGEPLVRSGAFLAAIAARPSFYASGLQSDLLRTLSKDVILKEFYPTTRDSVEARAPGEAKAGAAPGAPAGPTGEGSFLARFCQDFTASAQAGKIDPVFGRDEEIRQVIDILARRRKNNPILVGEPGVGKTAVIEGLALRVTQGDVPEMLLGVSLLGLDLGALEAGAGMKGEFENRLRGVINEVKASPKPIILFIDEAHTLVGAGGAAGGSDAANLLKPALARGELRTCAATTWSEYKKYFEKDPALARRFQLVNLKEPDAATAELILQGLRGAFEKAHKVVIRGDALTACATFADRYITGRFLPDKAIDLLDTSAARVKINITAKPGPVEDLEQSIRAMERVKTIMDRDRENNVVVDEEKYKANDDALAEKRTALEAITARWKTEQQAAQQVIELRDKVHEAAPEDKDAAKAELTKADEALTATRGEGSLIQIEVTPDVVALVVSDWTGIPLGKVQRDESETVLHLAEKLEERIKGQDMAIDAVTRMIKASKAGIRNPDQPIGVFLLVGPSGTGKTETSLVLADLLFGGQHNIVTINMTEFTEGHTVSRLIGSPPGYVGFGEGGMLTEAVRQRPYSVVVLDEAEKAHLSVMELFYQVFDKGVLHDGEGKEISFKNTVIMLTSNLGSDVIQEMTNTDTPPPSDAVISALRPLLSQHFKPALLARMTIVPYCSLNEEALRKISLLKLQQLAKTMYNNNRMQLLWDDAVPEAIAKACTTVETGARNIEIILNDNVLPRLSQQILESLSKGDMPAKARLTLAEDGEIAIAFEE